MGNDLNLDLSRIFRDTPILIFIFVGIVLTQSSMLFPQNLGSFRKEAGWPLTMYQARYRLDGDIDPTGKITRRIVKDDTNLMGSRIFLNIVFWTLLLHGTWWVYEKSDFLKFGRFAK